MSISDYEKTIYNMRSVPLKRTKEVEERLMTALEMANAQLRVIIGHEDEPLKIRAYQGKRMKIVQMMNELGISLKRDITAAINEVANDVASTEQDATNDLLLEHDDANLMVDFTEIPRQTAYLLAQRYDVDGLRISSTIWAQSQVGEIENVVLSGIARGQSAAEMSNQLSQFMLGGGTGMGTSVQAKAMRLARTEINNAYWESARRSSAQSPVVKGIKWELSGRHPEYDVCNLLAEEVTGFSMGAGVYPPEYLPAKPHPNCLCYQVDVLRDVDEWDQPKTDYTKIQKGVSSPLKKVMEDAELTYIPFDVVASKGFKKRQLKLFRDSIANAIDAYAPVEVKQAEVLGSPALPPNSPVAKVYNLMVQGGEENSEKLKLGFRREGLKISEQTGYYEKVGDWSKQTMTATEIGEAFKLGQRISSEEVPVSVNFPPRVLSDMLKSGRSKNLFETGEGLGSTNQERRAEWERDLVEVGSPEGKEGEAKRLYSKMPAEQKPSYGALNLGNDIEGGAYDYGDAWLELENHVKDKSTFTPANSSGAKGISTFKNAETFFQHERGRQRVPNVQNNTKPHGYIEVQIWGGIDYKKDVKAIHISEYDLGVIDRRERERVTPIGERKAPATTKENLEEFAEKFDVELIIHRKGDAE